jgi:hypothetical protein
MSNKTTPLSSGTAQGGKGPPHGKGGPVPIPAAKELETKKGDKIKKRKVDILIPLDMRFILLQSYN